MNKNMHTRGYNIFMACAKRRNLILDRALLMSRTRDQKRFTISELAADWHELINVKRLKGVYMCGSSWEPIAL